MANGDDPNDLGLSDAGGLSPKGLGDLVNSMASARGAQTAQQQQQTPQVPQPGLPNIVQFIGGLINPSSPRFNPVGASTGARAPVFENFIANTLYALGQGFANEGHGPGAAMRGAGAAATAPYQRDLQNFQLQQEANKNQAQIGQAQAQTALTGAQTQETELNTQMLKRRLGMMDSANPQDAINGLGQLSTDEQAVVKAAQAESSMKGDMTPLLQAVEKITTQRAIGGRSGPSAIVEDGDSKTGFSKLVYNKEMTKAIGVIRDVAPPPGLVPKTTASQHIVLDKDQNPQVVTLTSTTTPNVPKKGGGGSTGGTLPGSLRKPSGGPTAIPIRAAGGGTFQGKGSTTMMVGTDSQGRQVAGIPSELNSAGVTSFTPMSGGEKDKVNTARQLTSPGGLFSLVDQDLARFKPGELEGLAPRWNEFLAAKVGTADPRYVALRTHLNGLLGTAMMQAHVGARGGENMMEHFEDIANAGKMSMGTLKAALNAERAYVEEKAMRPGAGGGQGISVTAPDGSVHTFRDQASAANFKRLAGIP